MNINGYTLQTQKMDGLFHWHLHYQTEMIDCGSVASEREANAKCIEALERHLSKTKDHIKVFKLKEYSATVKAIQYSPGVSLPGMSKDNILARDWYQGKQLSGGDWILPELGIVVDDYTFRKIFKP